MPKSRLSRREAMTTTALQLIGAASVLAPRAADAQQNKVPQKAAGYQDQPQNNHRCAICLHFEAPNTCQIVEGQISPNGWCKLFAPKTD